MRIDHEFTCSLLDEIHERAWISSGVPRSSVKHLPLCRKRYVSAVTKLLQPGGLLVRVQTFCGASPAHAVSITSTERRGHLLVARRMCGRGVP